MLASEQWVWRLCTPERSAGVSPVVFLLGAAAVLAAPGRASRARPTAAPTTDASAAHVAAPARARFAGRSAPAATAIAVGLACLAAFGVATGLVAAAVGCPVTVAVVRWAQRRPQPVPPDPGLPLVLDLTAAALRAGRPLADALSLGAAAGAPATAEQLRRVAGLCRLGADPVQAWAAMPAGGALAAVAPVAVRSAASGSKLAAAFERLAGDLRAQRAADAAARAHRAGVAALAPLAACFLPSFVCVGVVPVVVGVARSSLGVLP